MNRPEQKHWGPTITKRINNDTINSLDKHEIAICYTNCIIQDFTYYYVHVHRLCALLSTYWYSIILLWWPLPTAPYIYSTYLHTNHSVPWIIFLSEGQVAIWRVWQGYDNHVPRARSNSCAIRRTCDSQRETLWTWDREQDDIARVQDVEATLDPHVTRASLLSWTGTLKIADERFHEVRSDHTVEGLTGLRGSWARFRWRCGSWGRGHSGEVTVVAAGSIQDDDMWWHNFNITKQQFFQTCL